MPRGHRTHRRVTRRQEVGDATHPHRVGVDEAVEPQFLPQQVGHDPPAKRGGPLRVRLQTRQLDVGGHDRPRAGVDAGTKRRQLDPVEPRSWMGDERQPEMRVDIGVAVTGKVLDGGDHATIGQTADIRSR